MVTAGSRESFIHMSHIIAFVGQQNVKGSASSTDSKEGLYHTIMRKTTLLGPQSRGFVEHSYRRGCWRHEEFFFSTPWEDAKGIIDTACNTAEIGYIFKIVSSRIWKLSWHTTMALLRSSGGNILRFYTGKTED